MQRFNTPVNINVISYTRRRRDTDGCSVKAALDAIVACGILTDDTSDEVKKISFSHHICNKGEEEKTIIEIEDD